MFKKLAMLCVFIVSLPVNAGDKFWLEGKTDTQHQIDVYRSESCGCCKTWITHLKDHNFIVNDHVVADVTPMKQKLGVPKQGYSCHTATINGKVIEGHVPAQDIKRLLADSSSKVRLLAVPGMVSGSPGMDMPGAPKDEFAVFALDTDNKVSIYSEYKGY